jgi:hypothetical protein
MSKNVRRILITGIVAAACVLLLVVFMYLVPEPVQEEELAASPTPTETPVYYIIKAEGDSVAGIECRYSDGTVFNVSITANENGGFSYDAEPRDAFFEYNTSKFRSMMYTMTSLTATALVETDPEDLSVYGLDKPQFSMKLTFTDGGSVTLYVGNQTPIAGNYYVNTDRDDTVYTIGSYLSALVMRKPIMYRKIDEFPTYQDEDIYTSINYVGITRRDGTPIDIYLDSDFSMEGNKASSAYMMTSPVRTSCADDQVQTDLMDKVATIKFGSILCDIGKDQLKDYGLDKPARLKLADVSGNSLDIVIGSAKDDSCYAVPGAQYDAFVAGRLDYLTILTYTCDSFEWLGLDYMSLLNRAIWLIDIHDVQSVVYDMDGKVYDMQLSEYDDVTGSGVQVVRVVSKINGKDINEDNTSASIPGR